MFFRCEVRFLTHMRSVLHTLAMDMTLLDRTVDMAGKYGGSVTALAKSAGVTPRWIYMLLNGEIKDPGVNRIQRLHDALIQNKTS